MEAVLLIEHPAKPVLRTAVWPNPQLNPGFNQLRVKTRFGPNRVSTRMWFNLVFNPGL